MNSIPQLSMFLADAMNDIPQLDTFLTDTKTLLITIGGVVFLICVAVAGIMRMISFGNERRIAISNMAITAAIVGLLIMGLAAGFQAFITNAMTGK